MTESGNRKTTAGESSWPTYLAYMTAILLMSLGVGLINGEAYGMLTAGIMLFLMSCARSMGHAADTLNPEADTDVAGIMYEALEDHGYEVTESKETGIVTITGSDGETWDFTIPKKK